jgi:hypothetical protein
VAISFILFAQPWWVNLLLLIPVLAYLTWGDRLNLGWRQLVYAGLFAIGFGFVEAAVVIYLRAAVGLLPGYQGTLSDVARMSAQIYQQTHSVSELPRSLLVVEVIREAATIVMLVSVALLAASSRRERWALFLWCFAIWDSMYYAGLWATVRWPQSLRDLDVLFLIPVPWVSAVWFPLLVNAMTLAAVIAAVASRPAAASKRVQARAGDVVAG